MTILPTAFQPEIAATVVLPDLKQPIEVGQPVVATTVPADDIKTVNTPPERREIPNVSAPRNEPPPLPGDRIYFKYTRNWEGVVVSVADDTFTAHVRNANDPGDRAEEEFEIPLEHVPTDDRNLVREGAIFYLTVGYWVKKGGQQSTDTRIVFRRMPKWSAHDIERADRRADEYMNFFGIRDKGAQTA